VFLCVALGTASYLTWRLFSKTRIGRKGKIAIGSLVVAIFLTTPVTILFRSAGIENSVVDVIVWTGYLGLGFLSFLSVLLIMREVMLVPSLVFTLVRSTVRRLWSNTNPGKTLENPSRRVFLQNGVNYGIVTAAVGLSAYGLVEAKQVPRVKKVSIPVAGLSRDLDGFRIVQITDIHVSPTIKRPFVEKVVRVANGLEPDMVALTGDLVDGTVPQLEHDVAPLADLKSAMGNFFVTGNHEYYSGVLEWIEKIETMGFTVLLNEHRLLSKGRGRLLVGGVTDYRGGSFMESHRSDPLKAARGAPSAHLKILLAHQPKSIFAAAKAGFDVQISGHTHGGQVLPWNFLIGLNQPFVKGLHRFQKTMIYVSRGTGYWGPPVRLGAPSEITLLQLTAV
ncbi:MAG: metallophosphoesterase, partial [Deltaproteobacteria bacterium]